MRVNYGLILEVSAVAFCAAVLTIALCMHGYPALHHDWVSAAYPGQRQSWLAVATSSWLSNGTGEWNLAIPSYVVSTALFVLSVPFGQYAEAIFVVIALTASYWSARYAASKIDGYPIIGGAVYATLPVVVYKLYAGHLAFLFAYALLPVAVISCMEAWAPAVCGAILALLCQQVQFVIFAAMMLFVRRSLRATAAFVAIISPALLVGSMVTMGHHALPPVPIRFESIQSARALDAISFLGYLTHSYEHFQPALIFARIVYGLIGVLGMAALALHKRWLLLALGIMGFVGTLGVNGPLGPAFIFGVRHFPIVGIFREFYHLSAGYAVAASLGFSVIARQCYGMSPSWLRKAECVVCVVALPFVVYPLVASAHALPKEPRGSLRIDCFPKNSYGRVLLEPAGWIVGIRGYSNQGIDPSQMDDEKVLILNDYHLVYPWLAGMTLPSYSRRQDDRVYQALGIQYIVVRKNMEDRTPEELEPSLKAAVNWPAVRRNRAWIPTLRRVCDSPRSALFATGDGALAFAATRLVKSSSPLIGVLAKGSGRPEGMALPTGIDPKRAWVPSSQWYFQVPSAGWVVPTVWKAHVSTVHASPRGMLLLGAHGAPRWAPNGTVHVLGLVKGTNSPPVVQLVPHHVRPLTVQRFMPWLWRVRWAGDKGVLIVLERFDTGFVVFGASSVRQHRVAYGYANAWDVASKPGWLYIVHLPGLGTVACVAIAWIVLLSVSITLAAQHRKKTTLRYLQSLPLRERRVDVQKS